MANEQDLFAEEQTMVAMSFGEHIEELRAHLVKALIGLIVGIVVTFIPPLNLGKRVVTYMQDPAQAALKAYYDDLRDQKVAEAKQAQAVTPPMTYQIAQADLIRALKEIAPKLELPPPESVGEERVTLSMSRSQADVIEENYAYRVEKHSALISLAPLESAIIFFMVCIVTGLVISSPWVFYQLWAFVAAGLYRHERHYVKKFLPFSLGLFLGGVFLCFFGVLPVTMQFLLQFNVWLGIEPTLRISEWMGFATILPLVFGLAFQTPLVMLFLGRLGIFSAEDYRAKRKVAILLMVILAAVLTPGPDVFSQLMLAVPMIALYELGIVLVGDKKGVLARVAD